MAKVAQKTEEPQTRDSASSKQAILAAALNMFARHGYDGASMPRIASLAGVAPPLIHYYFRSKENLWRETVDQSLGELHREATSILRATSALAPLDRLRTLLQVHAQFAARCPDHFSMIVAESRADSSRFAWIQENYTGLLFNDLITLLQDAQDAGVIQDKPLDQVAVVLISSILVYFTVYRPEPNLKSLEENAGDFSEMVFDMLLRGIAV